MRAPIDIKKVIELLNIELTEQDFHDSVSGFYIKKKNKNIIGMSKNHPIQRKRFTLAHEIGHHVLHSHKPLFVDYYRGPLLYRSESKDKDIKLERKANRYAAALLTPKHLIDIEIDKISNQPQGTNIYDDRVYEMSKTFKVSLQAMGFRLKSLGYFDYGF